MVQFHEYFFDSMCGIWLLGSRSDPPGSGSVSETYVGDKESTYLDCKVNDLDDVVHSRLRAFAARHLHHIEMC
jgi:hypothetical protein